MRTVMFWSPKSGHGKTSAHAAMTAITAALQYRHRLMLCHNDNRGCGIEYSILADMSLSPALAWQDSAGVDRLRYLYQSGILTRDTMHNVIVPLIRDRLHLLPGTRYPWSEYTDHLSFWQFMLRLIKQEYDIIWMDAGAGEDKLPLLTEADLIVVNLTQHAEILDHFFADPTYQEWMNSGRCLLVLGSYHSHYQFNQQIIIRKYAIKCPIYTIDYCSSFSDAWNTQHLLSFMRHRLILDWPEKQKGRFFRQSFLLTSGIMKMLHRLDLQQISSDNVYVSSSDNM